MPRQQFVNAAGGVVGKAGEDVEVLLHTVGDPVEDAIEVPAATGVVLIEGLYLLHRGDGWNLDGLLDACWYLDVDLATATERLVARHRASWSMSLEQAQARVDANDRLNAQIVAATRSRADALLG